MLQSSVVFVENMSVSQSTILSIPFIRNLSCTAVREELQVHCHLWQFKPAMVKAYWPFISSAIPMQIPWSETEANIYIDIDSD